LKKLYLDIDGVLLTTKQTTTADFAIPFIDFVTNNFECYWLTTHCKGNINSPLTYLARHFDSLTLENLQKIKPTNWTTLKTEAIEFSSDFIWVDDNPFVSEINILTAHSSNDKLIIADLNNPDELKRILEILKIVMSDLSYKP
jgi:hypothetical protein